MSCLSLRGRLVATSLLSVLAQAAEEPTPLIVTGQPEPVNPPLVWRAGPPAADATAWLRGQPGVRAVRMGGHALDPVVDGQGGSRLRTTIDGCPVQGGCPNRMDPPTSYAAAGSFDTVELDRGRLDVREAGGSAGSLRVERNVPRFAEGGSFQGRLGGSVAGQGSERQGWADASVGGATGGLRAMLGSSAAGNYRNGDGDEIRSGWRQWNGTLLGAWRPTPDQEYSAGGTVVQSRDVLFAGAGMDAPKSDLRLLRAGTVHQVGDSSLTTRVFSSAVEHEMDNFSLRPVTGMAMRTATTANVVGGRADLLRREGILRPGLGLDLEIQRHDGQRMMGTPTALNTLDSLVWPEATSTRVGGYGELECRTGPWRSAVGVRLDVVGSRADARDGTLGMGKLTPRQLYRTYYGTEGDARQELLPGAVVRSERRLGGHATVGLSLGRTMRAADINERFLAMNGMGMTPAAVAAGRWVGNPDLAAEVHHQQRLTGTWRDPGVLEVSATAFADRVHQHIHRDRARGQDGVVRSDGATIYHNTEALYLGSGLGADWRFLPAVSLGTTVDQVWAKDLTSDLPLAQIPPLSGQVTLRGHLLDERLIPAATTRWAARQHRVDDAVATGSGIDPGQTPGWAVLDLRLTWIQPGLGEAAIGVDNLLDLTYADHLAKGNGFDPTVARVDEPGRSLWASVEWRH